MSPVLDLCFHLKPPANDKSSVNFGTASCLLAFVAQPLVCVVGLALNSCCIGIFCLKTNRLSHGWLMPILLSVNYCSVWTMTAITVERYRAICKPFSAPFRRTVLLIFCIVLISIGLNVIRYWEFEIRLHDLNPNANGTNSTAFITFLLASELRLNRVYQAMMNKVIYGAFVYVIPMVVLFYLNFCILTKIRASRRAVDRISNQGMSVKRENNQLRSSCMIIAIVLTFFFCHTGSLLVRLFLTGQSWMMSHYMLFNFLSDLSNLLINLNSAANPLLYFMFTRKFRDITRPGRKKSSERLATSTLVHIATRLTAMRRSCPDSVELQLSEMSNESKSKEENKRSKSVVTMSSRTLNPAPNTLTLI